MPTNPTPEQSQKSFALIFLMIRISGLLLIGGGLVIAFGVLGDMPMEFGVGLAIMGVIELLIVPVIFSRAVSKPSVDKLMGKPRQDRDDG